MTPILEAWLDGARVARLQAPAQIAPRDWILGVLAVQFDVAKGKVQARLRGNVTGAEEPAVVELAPPAVVHITLRPPDAAGAPELPPIGSPTSHEAFARLRVFLDGTLIGDSELGAAPAEGQPPARGFGHVFCRWLRAGDAETGFDLTDFKSRPEGAKFERLVTRGLAVGQVVSYALAAAPVSG
jgi:hypothetical protein